MTDYADTNFLVAFLVNVPKTDEAVTFAEEVWARGVDPLPISRLLWMEVTNALQRLLFEARNGVQEIRITPEIALLAEARFLDGLEEGDQWRRHEADPLALMTTFNGLVHRHTARHGFRTYDILHVASALTLRCDTFLSFDARAKKLAVLEGLKTN